MKAGEEAKNRWLAIKNAHLDPQPYWGYEDYECLHTRARETLEVVLARRLHLDWRRPNRAKLRADAKTGGSLAEFRFGYSFGAPQNNPGYR